MIQIGDPVAERTNFEGDHFVCRQLIQTIRYSECYKFIIDINLIYLYDS